MAAVKPHSKEFLVEQALLKAVREAGGRCDKVQFTGKRGFPDRLVALPGGVVMFVEVKRPRGGRISPNQYEVLRAYEALGVVVAIVRNEEDIARLLREHSAK